MDTFKVDLNKTEELLEKLRTTIDEVKSLKKMKPGSNTAKQEYMMRSQV